MKRSYVIFLPVLLSFFRIYGQPAEAENLIEKEISFLLWEDIDEEVWVRSGEEWVQLRNLSPYRRSETLQYEGLPELVLHRKTLVAPEGEAEGEEAVVYVSVGKVTVDPGLKKPLVILVPSAGNGFQLRGMAFEDHPSDFPMGTYKIFNMSRRELAVGLDDKVFALTPGKVHQVDPGKEGNAVLEFRLLYRDEAGEPVVAQKTVFRYRKRRREILFIKEDPERKDRFQTHMVMEYAPLPGSGGDPVRQSGPSGR